MLKGGGGHCGRPEHCEKPLLLLQNITCRFFQFNGRTDNQSKMIFARNKTAKFQRWWERWGEIGPTHFGPQLIIIDLTLLSFSVNHGLLQWHYNTWSNLDHVILSETYVQFVLGHTHFNPFKITEHTRTYTPLPSQQHRGNKLQRHILGPNNNVGIILSTCLINLAHVAKIYIQNLQMHFLTRRTWRGIEGLVLSKFVYSEYLCSSICGFP